MPLRKMSPISAARTHHRGPGVEFQLSFLLQGLDKTGATVIILPLDGGCPIDGKNPAS